MQEKTNGVWSSIFSNGSKQMETAHPHLNLRVYSQLLKVHSNTVRTPHFVQQQYWHEGGTGGKMKPLFFYSEYLQQPD
jgi:hypothetical protein